MFLTIFVQRKNMFTSRPALEKRVLRVAYQIPRVWENPLQKIRGRGSGAYKT